MRDETEGFNLDEERNDRRAAGGRAVEPGRLLAGRFFLKEVIGRGGSGTVFSARDTQLNQRVAVKVLHPGLVGDQGVERLRREVRAARGAHPHMVTIYDLHSDGDVHFLSMELVEGRSVKELIKERGKLDPGEVVTIGAQVAEALTSLHARGVIHRDVKPSNILITPDGEAKLCDLGLARFVASGMTVTETAMVVGTPAYMAPEQALGKDLTPAVDIYALGLTLYAMLTGEAPLQDVTALSTLMRRQRERAPAVRRGCPDAPRWLGRLISRMLEPAPGDRPSSAVVHRALEGGFYGFWARRRAVAAAVLLLLFAVSAPVAYSVLRRSQTVRFQEVPDGIRGADAHGRTTWTFHLGAPVGSAVTADLDGDGRPELVVGSTIRRDAQRREGGVRPAWIAVLTLTGHVLTHVRAQDVIRSWGYPYPEDLFVYPEVMDLDKDGTSEVVVRYQQRGFYPSGILVYWPRWDVWDDLLSHRGYINDVVPAPGPSPGLRFAGVNNRLCMLRVAGEIGIIPPSSPVARENRGPLGSPEIAMGESRAFRWRWYTPLGGPSSGVILGAVIKIKNGPDSSLICQDQNGRRFTLDRFGNPEGSPNTGRDLRAMRRSFLQMLSRIARMRGSLGVSAVRATLEHVRAECAPLFDEPPYGPILNLKGARALARGGDLPGAVTLLKRTRARIANEDVIYRLAQLEALAGRCDEARAEIQPVLDHPITPRGAYDMPQLGIRLGIVLQDPAMVEGCIRRLVHLETRSAEIGGLVSAFMARAHLWWDTIGPADIQTVSYTYEPAGAALACLCRWRTGRSRPGDAALMRRIIASNPDALYEGQTALAAAELSAHHPERALSVLDREITVLRLLSRDDFFDHQLFQLARGVRVKALLAARQTKRAREAAKNLLVTATPGLLPARLAHEVLAGTS
ncbi:MAG: serine/threonine protein kinase [Acidobacteria bacterium]|nr:serine/threonine protein kinase [Acidobacteriota bacterium]